MAKRIRAMGRNATLLALFVLSITTWATTPATAQAGKNTKIEFWTYYTAGDGKVMAAVVDAFNKQSVDVEVAFRVPPSK